MNFADQLRAVRKRLGCSQSALVLLLPGVPLRTLQAWERNQQQPPKYVQTLVLWALGGPPYQKPRKVTPKRLRAGVTGPPRSKAAQRHNGLISDRTNDL